MTLGWQDGLLGGSMPEEGQTRAYFGRPLTLDRGVLRDPAMLDAGQTQTRDTFAFKWKQRETYLSDAMQAATRTWLKDRYGNLLGALGRDSSERPIILDAGCGAGNAAFLLFENDFEHIRYVGADISDAVDLARERISPLAPDALFLQADVMALPLADCCVDIVLSEGVLHHTPSTECALASTARLVKPGGLFAIYVYKKKAPIREFTDDYLRERLAELPPEEAWARLMPLTKLGKALGDLDAEIDIEEEIDLLGIPKGRINIQRLFYWYVFKAYHRPDFSLEEMNHVNFDWFTPTYCHRQTPEEVRGWCEDAGLTIERMTVEEAGITVIGRRPVQVS
ncbi:MAG: class I SAM-dependent methyltransferase [Geminicoccaceae bacterium]|jgi:SAM-dependent methyltransferase